MKSGVASGATAVGAGGGDIVCALVGGLVKRWGYATTIAGLGDTAATQQSAAPITANGLSGVTALGVAADSVCAVSSGTVTCWPSSSSPTPAAVPSITNATAVTVRYIEGGADCALLTTGGVSCWGIVLGNGTFNQGELSQCASLPRAAPLLHERSLDVRWLGRFSPLGSTAPIRLHVARVSVRSFLTPGAWSLVAGGTATAPRTEKEAGLDAAERRALFAAKQKAIRRAVRRFAATADDADDIVQDTAVLVFAHDSGPPDAEHFVGWCYAVARHLALHRHRSEARALGLKECLQSLSSPFVEADPERTLAAQSRLEALAQLDDAALSLLWSRFVLEETSVEVASRLNISAIAVRMRLARLIACVRASEKSTEPPE